MKNLMMQLLPVEAMHDLQKLSKGKRVIEKKHTERLPEQVNASALSEKERCEDYLSFSWEKRILILQNQVLRQQVAER